MKKQRPSFKNDQETIPYLEEARKYYLGKTILDIAIAAAFGLVGLTLLISGPFFAEGRFTLLFGILGLALVILIPVIFILKARRRPRQFKMAVFSTLLLLYAFDAYDNFAFMYSLDEERVKKDFLVKEFKPIQEDATARYKGNIRKVTFTSFSYDYAYQGAQEKGRYIAFKLPVFVHSSVLVINKKDKGLFNIPEELKQSTLLGNKLFDERFTVLAEDNNEALSVINAQRIQGLCHLEEELKCRLALYFTDNRCFVYLNDFKDSYHPSMLKSISQADLDGVKRVVHMIHHIYQELNLDYGNE